MSSLPPKRYFFKKAAISFSAALLRFHSMAPSTMETIKKIIDAQAEKSYAAVGSNEIGGHATSHRCTVRGASRYAIASSDQARATNVIWIVANSPAADRAAVDSRCLYSDTMVKANSPAMSAMLTTVVRNSVDIIFPPREDFEVRLFRTATSTGVNSPVSCFSRFEKLIYIYHTSHKMSILFVKYLHPTSDKIPNFSLQKSPKTLILKL